MEFAQARTAGSMKNTMTPRQWASTGSFGEKDSADPSQAGKEGAEAQSTADKAKGGEHSHDGD